MANKFETNGTTPVGPTVVYDGRTYGVVAPHYEPGVYIHVSGDGSEGPVQRPAARHGDSRAIDQERDLLRKIREAGIPPTRVIHDTTGSKVTRGKRRSYGRG